MMTGDLLSRTVQPVQNALRDAGISASQLGKVLLVGGSTRMPAVERQVKELLGKEPSRRTGRPAAGRRQAGRCHRRGGSGPCADGRDPADPLH